MLVIATSTSIVINVTAPKMSATDNTSSELCCAAGYMNRGISASHGPKMKITKIAQGVIDLPGG